MLEEGVEMYKKEIKYADKEININVEIKRILMSEAHWHESIEILYVLEGSIDVVKVDHTYRLNKGDLYIINSHDIHQIKYIGTENLVLQANIHESYFIKTHGEFYEHMFECRYIKGFEEEYYIENKRDVVNNIKDLMLRIFTTNRVLISESDKFCNYSIRNRLIQESNYHLKKLADVLIKEFEVVNSNKRKHSLDDISASRYYQFMRFLCVNYNKKISLEDIAKDMNLNKFYVSHLIKERTGSNYKDLLRIFRVENAKRMLVLTNNNISKIAEENGFSNSGSFINQFKEKYFLTPKEYREKYKINTEREVTELLNEDEYLDILNKNLDNFNSFYKSVKVGERLEIHVDLSKNKSYCKEVPKITHKLIGLNGLSDLRKLDRNRNLFKFNEDKLEFSIKLSSETRRKEIDFKEIFSNLIDSIEKNEEIIEEVLIKSNNVNYHSLFDERDIETEYYYFNTFISNLKKYIIGYSRNYVVTWDGNNEYYILYIVNKEFKEDKESSLVINLNNNDNEKVKGIISVLEKNNNKNIYIESLREKEIERINMLPSMYVVKINNNQLSLKLKDEDIVSIEITIYDN